MATSLQVYLQDHLAGARFGLELVERCSRNNQGSAFAELLAELAAEIRSDRQTLIAVMRDLQANPSPLKISVAWVLEKAQRLKPNGSLLGYAALARLLELESLAVGIAGKKAMWRVLEDVASCERRLGAYDFGALAERAEHQIAQVEALRLDAARVAFGHEGKKMNSSRLPSGSRNKGSFPRLGRPGR